MSRAYTIAATFFTGLTLLLGYWCTRLRWAPRVDFDILGILWLFQNIPQLFLVTITLGSAGAAIYLWARRVVEG
jgi:hypothetical protein